MKKRSDMVQWLKEVAYEKDVAGGRKLHVVQSFLR
jgi:hypothetical protein